MPDDAALRAREEDLRTWRSEFPDATPIGEVRPRHPTQVVGVVWKLRLIPGRSIEASIEDGTGRLTGVWTGRTRLPGVALGAGLELTGTVALERDGRLLMRNPEYALVAEPYG
jgi:hypothetical protein